MIAFDSYHYAVQAEQLLAGWMPVRVMPTLRCVSESCGMSLRLAVPDGEAGAGGAALWRAAGRGVAALSRL